MQPAEPTPSVEENKPEPSVEENTPASTDGEAEGTELQGGEATSGDESAEPVDTTDNTNEANGEAEPTDEPTEQPEIVDEVDQPTEQPEEIEESKREVRVEAEMPKVLREGEAYLLKATLVGFKGDEITAQWQWYDVKEKEWVNAQDVENGAQSLKYQVRATRENLSKSWRVVITVVA